MKTQVRSQESEGRSQQAFTLIELLVVIAIIALLAGLTLTVTSGINKTKMKSLARASLAQIEADIETYKAKTGIYPPDNPSWPSTNQLYYELVGTVLTNQGGKEVFITKDGSAQFDVAQFTATFGVNAKGDPNVSGFVNCTRGAGGDEGPRAENFLRGMKSSQLLAATSPNCTVLGVPLDGPVVFLGPNGNRINPWRYNSSSPTNNPKTYDLWIDFTVGGKINRVSNWNQRAEVL